MYADSGRRLVDKTEADLEISKASEHNTIQSRFPHPLNLF